MQLRVVEIVALLLAITIHEAAHAWASDRLGDPTPRMEGRLTLNPIAHLDLFGTIVFPLLLIIMRSPVLLGWAKPVPINPGYYRNPLKGRAMVSLAGPLSNICLAVAAGLLLKLRFLWPMNMGGVSAPLFALALYTVTLNVLLAVFNLIPIPPLDGGHFLESVVPADFALILKKIEPFGILIILGLLYAGLLDLILVPIHRLITSIILG